MSSRSRSNGTCGSRWFWVPAGVKTFRQPVRRQVSVSMSISGTTPHRARIAVFSRRRFRGSGAASSGVRWIAPALRRSAIFS